MVPSVVGFILFFGMCRSKVWLNMRSERLFKGGMEQMDETLPTYPLGNCDRKFYCKTGESSFDDGE